MRVGFILLDKKRPRVLTPALKAAAEQHGFAVVVLDPADPAHWEANDVDVIVHKVPEDAGLDGRLESFQQHHPQLVLLDSPAAVRRLQDREQMLAPLAGRPLLLRQPVSTVDGPQRSCIISIPAQVQLPAGCTLAAAQQALSAAAVSLPALVKPLHSAPTDLSVGGKPSHDGHTLGAVLSNDGLARLVAGVLPELQLPAVLQQFVPHGHALYKLYVIGPHVVLTRRSTLTLQHLEAAASSADAAAAADGGEPANTAATTAAAMVAATVAAGKQGLVLLQRVSAAPLPAHAQTSRTVATASTLPQHQDQQQQHPEQEAVRTQQQQPLLLQGLRKQQTGGQQQQQQPKELGEPCVQVITASGLVSGSSGVALNDASVGGDLAAPPLWAMQQLAAYLREQLQLNLFNIDIIAPEQQPGSHSSDAVAAEDCIDGPVRKAPAEQLRREPKLQQRQQQQKDQQGQQQEGHHLAAPEQTSRTFLVVDINFFPGFDKVPGAEQLFADFLASLANK